MVPSAASPGALVVFTIGHSNHSLAAFVSLLAGQRIDTLADVRKTPHSRRVPHFAKTTLQAAVTAAGMRYVYLGRELGGRFDEPHLYDPAGGVDWDLAAGLPRVQRGLAHLCRLAAGRRLAVMCAEEDPDRCHRRHLIARQLVRRGVPVRHIRRDGAVTEEPALPARQLPLF